ncbi:hypothetical protein C4D60_Mb09t10460 [Musa balbisiana]|uniref:Uncharacterized protein n=1 Tax=Musa balbisiana TaxID=52838 RepID=A0A4S8IFI5_MUSBA|nr:hypothetical protein C4D60_Mb09t10460 [Musa balbisiana]
MKVLLFHGKDVTRYFCYLVPIKIQNTHVTGN